MYNYTEDEVRQMDMESVKSDIEELKSSFDKSEDIRTKKTDLRIGNCYLINVGGGEYKGILLDIDDCNTCSFITSGNGLIGALERLPERLRDREDLFYIPLGRSHNTSDYVVVDGYVFYGSVIKIKPDETDGTVLIRELR
jgi:hypothetical protein